MNTIFSNTQRPYVSTTLKVIRFISRCCVGVILYFCLAHFVPELRTVLPTFYQLIDLFIGWMESAMSFVFGRFL